MLKGITNDNSSHALRLDQNGHGIEAQQTKSTKEFQETGKFINPLEYELAMNSTACKFG